ncbi:hypothetical protein DFH09DRAFT_406927 [Mycena vulgaris]|nr:hypothetical protein DFH09DRAFT_406927 [Mycena vulgaris]
MAEDPPVGPTLPFELERQIFELAALSRPALVPTLLRVAWRVKHWVEPLLYRTLVIDTVDRLDGIPSCSLDTFMHIRRNKSASFIRDSVRNLFIYLVSVERTRIIISACTGAENLWLIPTGHPDPIDSSTPRVAVDSMSLRHLYCDFEDFCGLIITFGSFAHPSFSHLTHLELFDGLHDEDDDPVHWTGLTALAHLTHLSFDTYKVLALCPHLLTACKSLRALVLLRHRPPRKWLEEEFGRLAQDSRFVVMPLDDYAEDWQRGVLNGMDYWARADAFIAKKISGEINRRTFFLGVDSEEEEDT